MVLRGLNQNTVVERLFSLPDSRERDLWYSSITRVNKGESKLWYSSITRVNIGESKLL